jgi:hypothetical protein
VGEEVVGVGELNLVAMPLSVMSKEKIDLTN